MTGFIRTSREEDRRYALALVKNEARTWESRLAYASRPEVSLADIARVGARMAEDIAQTLGPRTKAGPQVVALNAACEYLDLIRAIYRDRAAEGAAAPAVAK